MRVRAHVCFNMGKTSFVQGLSDSPDFEFEYADTDKWAAELSGVWALCGHFKCQWLLYITPVSSSSRAVQLHRRTRVCPQQEVL